MEKNTLQKDSTARELGRERERERGEGRGGDVGERDDHKRCEEDGEIMLDVGMSVCVPLSCDSVCVCVVFVGLALTKANDIVVFRFIIIECIVA